MTRLILTILAQLALLINLINGFTILPQQHHVSLSRAFTTMNPTTTLTIKSRMSNKQQLQHNMLPPSSSSSETTMVSMMFDSILSSSNLLTAVETFDGNSIVDPVVVSNVFWTSIKAKLIGVIIGQLLATLAFALLSTLVATQISQLGDFVSQKIFQQQSNDSATNNNNRDFVKANTSQYEQYQQQQQASSQRPTPAVNNADFGKLFICIAIDIIGSSSELIPVIGELTDVIYAPIAATTLRSLYGGSNVIFALEFAEEILPLTDILPLATICWVVDTYFADSDLAKILQLGIYNNDNNSNASVTREQQDGVIDVSSASINEDRLPSLGESKKKY